MSTNDVIRQEHEIKQSRTIIDPRSFWTRLWDTLEKPWLPLAWAILSLPLILLWPALIMPLMVVQFILWLAVVSKPDTLPIHLPMESGAIDKNDPKPGDNQGYYKARGSFFLGRCLGTGIEIWLSFKALTQHFLLFGTTGSGKTESMVSYLVNYLSVGSGVAFQDAKAAPKAMIQLATHCRIFGRDDDFRVTNYITGNTSNARDPAERLSNDAAVFARGSAESNTQLLVALLPPSEGDNKVFAERAVALVSAVMPALVDLRDQSRIQIDPSTIRKFMGFKQFAELYRNNFIRKSSRDAMVAFLESLPGFDDQKDIAKQPDEVTRQFGFAFSYFTRSLASLSDTYGHIYLTALGEIDYQDSVLNGRILLTLLPSMEKSGEELSNLGKIVLTATRNGMVVGLGTVFEGSADDIVHNLPTNSDIPYGVFNDENAYMLVEGQEMINAQARGLGFGVLTGTQDAPGMLENISRTTKQIMANSAIKQIMYLDDAETTKLACEFSGEAQVMVRNRFTYKGDLGNIYADPDVQVEKKTRLDTTAIRRQGLGQAFIMYQGKIHQTQVFNHGIVERHKDPKMCYLTHWYSVRMPKVRLPDLEMMADLIKSAPDIQEWHELAILVSDDARSMRFELKTYFNSMLRINKVASSYKGNAKLLAMVNDFAGSEDEDIVDDSLLGRNDKLVGLLAKIVKQKPASYRDVPTIISMLAQDESIAEVKLQREADKAGLVLMGLDDYDDTPFEPDQTDDKDGESGKAGGGLKAIDQSAGSPTDELLGAYLGIDKGLLNNDPLGTSQAAAANEASHAARHHGNATDEQTEDSKGRTTTSGIVATSAMAKAVERNLHNMPWMANAVVYEEVTTAMIDTESFFTGNNEQAENNVLAGMDMLSQHLIYPETDIKSAGLNIKSARDLMGPLLNNRGS